LFSLVRLFFLFNYMTTKTNTNKIKDQPNTERFV
jgi:hypothetical protein